MTATAAAERICAFRVHLPQVVRHGARETAWGRRRCGIRPRPAFALNNSVNRPCRDLYPFVGEHDGECRTAPADVTTQLADPMRDGGRRALRTDVGATTPVD